MKTLIDAQNLQTTEVSQEQPSTRWALTGLSLSMLLSSLGISIANVALPSLTRAFAASFQEVQWVVLAYLLVITALIVGVGRMGDVVGRRLLLQAGIAIHTLASIACGVSTILGVLIVSRAMQGVGAAIMMALTMAFVGSIVPKEKTGNAMGLLGTMSAVGTALGPSLGGLLIAGFGWRAIFLINLPLGVLAFFLSRHHLPADRKNAGDNRPRLDHAGTALLTLTLSAYALAMTLGRDRFGPLNVSLLLASAAGVGLFLRVEMKAAFPLVQLSLFRDHRMSANLAMSGLVSTVIMTTLVVGPFYLSRALGLDAPLVGMTMSVGPLVAALTGVPAGRFVDTMGTKRMTLAGLVGMAGGGFILSMLPITTGVGGYIAGLVIITSGYALFQTSNNTAVMTLTAPEHRGVTSGMLNLSRNLGLITGASVMGAVFSHAAGTNLMAPAAAADIAAGMRFTFGIAAGLSIVSLAIALTSSSLKKSHEN